MKVFFCFLFVVIFSVSAGSDMKSYHEHILYGIKALDTDALDLLKTYHQNADLLSMDFWSAPVSLNKTTHCMTHKNRTSFFEDLKKRQNFEVEILQDNVQKFLDSQDKTNQQFSAANELNFVAKYRDFSEISDWLDAMASEYSSIASIGTLGKSFEKREQKYIKIGKPGKDKKIYWIDGGIHAREWMSTATVNWIINELLTNAPKYDHYFDKIDFNLAPVLNPDGYEYSHKSDRLWRKTRSGPTCRQGWFGQQCCYGVDMNRNFDAHWGEETTLGARTSTSKNPCHDAFMGEQAFSEIETQNMRDFFIKHSGEKLQAAVNLHTFSELWFYMHGWAAKTYPKNIDEIKEVTVKAVNAIESVYGTRYNYGSPPDILYPATGSTSDYAILAGQARFSFALELRPGAGDKNPYEQLYGFNLPYKYIALTAKETWEGLKVVADKIIE